MNYFKLDSKNMRNLFIGLIIIGLFSILYSLYDLKYPNHFVGDMYGIEVMFRVFILLVITFLLFIGMVLIVIGWNKKNNNITMTGIVISIIFSLILFLMSMSVYFSRHKDDGLVKSLKSRHSGGNWSPEPIEINGFRCSPE